MANSDEIKFYETLEKTINKRHTQGKGCGCLAGLLILSGITTLIFSPNISYEELSQKWQKEKTPENVTPKDSPNKKNTKNNNQHTR